MVFDEVMDDEQYFQYLLRESEAIEIEPDAFAELMMACLVVRSERDVVDLVMACLVERPKRESGRRALEKIGYVPDDEDGRIAVGWWAHGAATPTPRIRRKMVAGLRVLPKPEAARS